MAAKVGSSIDGTFVLDPTLSTIAAQALDAAWRKAGQLDGMSTARTRELLAQRIIQMMQLGEREPAELVNDALVYLAERLPR